MKIPYFLIAIALLSTSLLLLMSCKDDHTEHTEVAVNLPVAKVEIVTVENKNVADQVEIMGTVQAAKKAIISSRINGNIIELSVSPGSRVDQGDMLVRINAEEISAKLMQAKALLDQATRNLQREKKLLAQKAATREAVKALEDAEKIAAANYKEAGTLLGYTTISAPFAGIITRKLINIGDLATSGRALLHLESEDDLQIEADVPETSVLNVQLDMKMDITVPTAGLTLQGVVSEIAPAADRQSRTVPIKLNIDNNDSLRSGQFARVTLPGTEVQTILIPSEAVLPLGQMERVFIVVDGRARLRLVRTGKQYREGVEILSGLSAGDTLIIADNTELKDGQPIEIR